MPTDESTFPAWIVRKDDGGARASFEDLRAETLTDGDTAVRVRYSGINYKDALALGGRPGVLRRHTLIPGIDLVGEVTQSDGGRWHAGDVIVLTGAGVGEETNGGLAGRARVPGDAAIALPDAFTPRRPRPSAPRDSPRPCASTSSNGTVSPPKMGRC